jgi:methylation protein EvaC
MAGGSTMTRRIGAYEHSSLCRFCGSSDLKEVLDFGSVPLAGGFLTEDQLDDEKYYPLSLHFCGSCTLVQVGDAVPPATLFRNYFYFSSSIRTLIDHFAEFSDEIIAHLTKPAEALVVEIGSNDGVFLKPLTERGVKAIGVDPASNVVASIDTPGLNVINDFFTEKVAARIREENGPADRIVSSYSLAHIDDMTDVLKGVKVLLKDDGQFIFEVYYLGALLDELQYDMIYHEHVNYYSMAALGRFLGTFGMEIFDVEEFPLRGGTLRYFVKNVDSAAPPVSDAVQALIDREHLRGLDSLDTYAEFAKRVDQSRIELMAVLGDLKREGKEIIGYGASGRATTIMSYCGIDARQLDYVVDDAPAKHGLFTPGSHLLIRPWSAAEESTPDYVLLFAWSFADEVIKKRAAYLAQGGKFIVPLPNVRIIG